MTNTNTAPRASILNIHNVGGDAVLLTVLFADGTRGAIRTGGRWWLESQSYEKYEILRDLLEGAVYA
jgi:hypothetical protein